MAQLTITEALQEIKTIGKRLERKRQAVAQYIARDLRVRDPLEKDGGSEKYITQERQSIADLEKRIITIRTAIQRSNLQATLAVGDRSLTVAEWLTWRRELSQGQKMFLHLLSASISKAREEVQRRGGKVVAASVAVNEAPDGNIPQVVVNIDEKGLLTEQEGLEAMLGDLDGKLSLFNATTIVDV